jgi:XTP/dITP diphosphohydrolase
VNTHTPSFSTHTVQKQWVLASHNAGKILEINSLLSEHGIITQPQSELGITPIAETGQTFVENALLKARHAALYAQRPALADDSGLVVPALGGAPGLLSARYAASGNPTDNIHLLLEHLNHADLNRDAYFYTVIVLLRHPQDPAPLICEGRWHGMILEAPRGSQGFGYDPIFWDPVHHVAAAELSLAQKQQLSHRGQALRQLLTFVNQASIQNPSGYG